MKVTHTVSCAGKPVHFDAVAVGREQFGSYTLVPGIRPLPSSPFGLISFIVTDTRLAVFAIPAACQTRLPQPMKPPCRVFPLLLAGSV